MERIPGFTPRRVAPGPEYANYRARTPELHLYGCGVHREVLYPGQVSHPWCPKCGPGDLSYANWGEKMRPSWRP